MASLSDVVDFEKVEHDINDLSKTYESVIKLVIQKVRSLLIVISEKSIVANDASCEKEV